MTGLEVMFPMIISSYRISDLPTPQRKSLVCWSSSISKHSTIGGTSIQELLHFPCVILNWNTPPNFYPLILAFLLLQYSKPPYWSPSSSEHRHVSTYLAIRLNKPSTVFFKCCSLNLPPFCLWDVAESVNSP